MKPLSNQILFKAVAAEKKVGTLFLAVSAQEQTNRGTVVATGPGKASKDGTIVIPMSVQVGDEILFVPEKAIANTYNGEKHFLISEDDVLAVM